MLVSYLSGLLLLSTGGAVVAGPVTQPLLVVAVRTNPTVVFRLTGAVISGLTVAESAWALVYVLVGEMSVVIWLVPAAGAVLAAVAFAALCGGRAA